MNPDQPSREQIETRITALLLGELPAEEAALLRYTISQDPELQKLHHELQATLVLVREAAKDSQEPAIEKAEALKLSTERRQKLLAHFKTQRTKGTPGTQAEKDPLFWLKRIKIRSLAGALTLLVIIGLLASLAMPGMKNLSRGQYGTEHGFSVFSDLKERIWSSAGEKNITVALSEQRSVSPAQSQFNVTTNSANLTSHLTLSGNPQMPALESRLGDTVTPAHSLPEFGYDSTSPASPAPLSAPQVMHGALTPQIAPPPVTAQPASVPTTQIILPQTEPTPEVLARGGVASKGEQEKAVREMDRDKSYDGFFVPFGGNPSPVASPPAAGATGSAGALAGREPDSQNRAKKAEVQPIVPMHSFNYSPDLAKNENADNTSGLRLPLGGRPVTGGFGGGGGGGGASTLSTFAGTTFGDRPAPPPTQPPRPVVAPSFALNDAAAVPPAVAPPLATVAAVPEETYATAALGGVSQEMTKSPERGYSNGFKERGGGLNGNTLYRNLSQATEKENVTTLSDTSVAGSVAMAETPPPVATTTPAEGTEYTIVSGDTLSKIAKKDGVTLKALEDANPGVDPKKLKPGKSLTIPTSTVSTAAAGALAAGNLTSGVASDSLAMGRAKDGGERLGYSGNNGSLQSSAGPNSHFTSRYAFTAVPSARLLTSTNYIATNGFVMNTFSTGVSGAVTNDAAWLGVLEHPSKPGVPPINTSGGQQEEIIAPGLIDFEGIDLSEALKIYGKLANRTVLRSNLPQGQIVFTNQAPMTKKEAIEALQAALALNGVSLVNVGDKYVKVIPSDQAGGAGMEIPQPDSEEAKKNQPYYDARRQLDEKLKMHELLYSKLEAEKLDNSLPQNSMVQLTDPAEPNRNQTFWQHLTGQYASTARIKVENDVTDIPGMAVNTPVSQGFDPYFIQTTFEVMQSALILSNVVEKLDLTSVWAKKNGGQKMNESEAISELRKRLDLRPVKNTKLVAISVTSDDPNEAANIANAVAQSYRDYRFSSRRALTANGVAALEGQFAQQTKDIQAAQAKVQQLAGESAPGQTAEQNEADLPLRKPAPNTPVPQPEILTRDNNFSTFSLNVSDVSFKLAEASLQNGKLPDTASIRSEEFINAFDYRDPEAAPGQPMAFTSERARYPFAHNRELLRFAIKTAAAGRQQGRALNLVLLLDNSGSMERADRVAIIHEALRVLVTQLQPQDTVSVVTFSRTARLWADGVSGDKAGETLDRVGGITPEGGTNLEEAMRLAYETAHRHYLANGINRVVLLTDGAANLGDVNPADLKQKVEAQRKQGIALDCFGIGWEDYNDDLLEQLSSNGDGRYAFLNSPEDASKDFAAKLAGALEIAAADVKVQVEFNPQRVISYRQIGYATHQLTKEQFRDNTVAAGQIAAQEAGNALYTIETNPNGEGPIATVHVRYKVPGTEEYREHSWNVDYTGGAPALDQSSSAMRLAATASAFSEWLAASPYAQEVTLDDLLKYLNGVPEVYGADDRPKQLETMIREAKSLEGK